MKTLKEILESSILSDIETTISKEIKDLYPVPTKKDFVKTSSTTGKLVWNCEYLLSNYEQYYKNGFPEGVNGLCIMVSSKSEMHDENNLLLGFSINKAPGTADFMNSWKIPGSSLGYSLSELKGIAVKIFQEIANNPELLKEIFEHHTKWWPDWCKTFQSTKNMDRWSEWKVIKSMNIKRRDFNEIMKIR